jgi:ABC-type amino acid transport substrate-binding protein
MRTWLAASAAALLLAAMATTARAAEEPLKVCLDGDLPPLSVHHRGKPDSGFDVALAQAVADRLGRPLQIQWIESKLDEDSSPALEANALLSDGRCSLVGGYALTKDSLVVPGVKTAKLPDFDGATRDDRRRRVPLGVLAPSQPYIYSALTIVLGPKARERHIAGVGDLAGLRLAIESGTLADAILMTFDKGRLIDDITHLVPGRDDLLGAVDRGDFDATLLDLRRFDAYRGQQGVDRFAGRRNRRRPRSGGRPYLSAAPGAGDCRRRVAADPSEVTRTSSSANQCWRLARFEGICGRRFTAPK